MKSIIRSLVIAAVVTLVTMSTIANAENTKQSIFLTLKACEVARTSGDFAIYVPVDVSKKDVNPIDNVNVFPVKLEADMCRYQHTMKGWKWVVQKGDTLMRARKNEAGELVIFARNDCGNADNTPTIPAPEPVVAAPTPTEKEEDRITQVIKQSFYIENPEYGKREYVPPPNLGFGAQDKYHGWCGIWTDLGCTVLAGVVIGGTVYIATQGNDDKKDGPIVHTDPPSARVGLTPRMGFIPPKNGHGGGLFLGGSISFK